MADYGVVLTEKIKATKVGPLFHLVYEDADLQNGMICMVGDIEEDGKLEVRKVVQPETAKLKTETIALIADPEVIYSEELRSTNSLQNYYIPAGNVFRAYHLATGDIFAVSENMIDLVDYEVEVGNYVIPQDGSFKMLEAASVTWDNQAFVGKIIDTRTIGTAAYVGDSGEVGRSIKLVGIEVQKNHRND